MKAACILELETKNTLLAILFQLPSWLLIFGGVLHVENLLQPVL